MGSTAPVDLVERFAFPLPVTVIGELLGIPAADRPMFTDLVRDWSSALEMFSPLAVGRADTAAARIRDHLAELAALRRSRPAEDLVSALVTAADPPPEDDLLATSALLFGAGSESTTGLLANGSGLPEAELFCTGPADARVMTLLAGDRDPAVLASGGMGPSSW